MRVGGKSLIHMNVLDFVIVETRLGIKVTILVLLFNVIHWRRY